MKTYIVKEDRLLKLLQAEDELQALESAGVDNWSGYEYVCDAVDQVLQYAEEIPEDQQFGKGIQEASVNVL